MARRKRRNFFTSERVKRRRLVARGERELEGAYETINEMFERLMRDAYASVSLPPEYMQPKGSASALNALHRHYVDKFTTDWPAVKACAKPATGQDG